MKARKTSNGLTVQLIAGTHVVLIALDLSEEKRKGCLGFSIQRETLRQGGPVSSKGTPEGSIGELPIAWLHRTIEGSPVSLERAPLQAFRLEDANVEPACRYLYQVVARYSMIQLRPDDVYIEVEITTEDPKNPKTAIFFNRGAARRVAFIERFGTTIADLPEDKVTQAHAWLSNGLEEGLQDFLAQAKGSGSALHVAQYQFQKPELLNELKAARERGADVRIVYNKGPKASSTGSNDNRAVLNQAGLSSVSTPLGGDLQNTLMRNKFVVRLNDGRPEAVWTGSTSWTENSIYRQLNYGHAIYDPEVAKKYEEYFQLIAKKMPFAPLKTESARLSPVPTTVPKGLYPIFLPQLDEKVLDLYASIAHESKFLFAFNILDSAPQLKQALAKKVSDPNAALFYLNGSPTKTAALKLEDFPEGSDAVFSVRGTAKQIPFSVGAKILASDLLGRDPVVIIGSSSFSRASTTRNWENSLLIRGNTAVADIYFTEMMYAFDQSLREANESKTGSSELVSDDSWSEPHYEPRSKRALIRRLFAGTRESGSSRERSAEKRNDETLVGAEEDFRYLGGFSADSAIGGKDLLFIEKDVKAFAALIASCSLVPPLSIGLFGEWGSGKTFFMDKLRDEVEKLSLNMQATEKMQRDLPFYKQIVQIEFNAWHYMEGNIWASLAEHIIKNLAVRGKEKSPNQKMIALLQDNLELKQQARQVAQKEVALAQVDVEKTAKELENAQAEVAQKEKELKSQQAEGVSRFLMTALKPKFEMLSQTLSLGVTITTAQDFKTALDEAHQVVDRAVPVITPLLRAKDKTKRLLMLLAILIGALVLGWLIGHGISLLGQKWIGKASQWITVAVAMLGGGVKWVRRQTTWVTDLTKQVKSLQDEYAASHEEAKKDSQEKVQILKGELDRKAANEKEAIVKQAEALKHEVEAKKQLEHATPANLLKGWLDDRAKKDDYSKHLGLLAIIRRDFDTLSNMMALINWRLAPPAADDSEKMKNTEVKKYKDYAEEKNEKDTQVSRIVLYIDDLDRCPPEKVVDVLQAVHLLLAFPLFVVVVGVDARWIKQSLKARYRQMLHMDGQSEIKNPEEIYFGKATPDDYLEKIFQIPFWLKPMDEKASWQLIEGLLSKSSGEEKKSTETMGQQDGRAPADLKARDMGEEEPIVPADAEASGNEISANLSPTESGHVEGPGSSEGSNTENQLSAGTETDGTTTSENDETLAWTEQSARSLENTPTGLLSIRKLTPLLGLITLALKRFADVYRVIKAALTGEEKVPTDHADAMAPGKEPAANLPPTESDKVDEPGSAEGSKTESQSNVITETGSTATSEHEAEQAARSLETTPAELVFIQTLTPLLGRSPRALKRFANVYRLIKAALSEEELKAFLDASAANDQRTLDPEGSNIDSTFKERRPHAIADYQAVLFLLAVDTGLPDLAGDFFAALEHEDFDKQPANGRTSLKPVLEAQLTWLVDRLHLPTASDEQGDLGEQRVKLREWLEENGPTNGDRFLHGAPDLSPLTVWAERVARFSFQVYGAKAISQQQQSTAKTPAKKRSQAVKKSSQTSEKSS